MKPHVQRLFDEVNEVQLFSVRYWYLRCIYCEKMHDPTYSDEERKNCSNLHHILITRPQHTLQEFTQ